MYDGCACGRERQWYSFDECRLLRHKKFFLKVISVGESKHRHEYYDPTWTEQSWLVGREPSICPVSH
jgi:hypothetical protein